MKLGFPSPSMIRKRARNNEDLKKKKNNNNNNNTTQRWTLSGDDHNLFSSSHILKFFFKFLPIEIIHKLATI
jgi:hypothetical protein